MDHYIEICGNAFVLRHIKFVSKVKEDRTVKPYYFEVGVNDYEISTDGYGYPGIQLRFSDHEEAVSARSRILHRISQIYNDNLP